MSDALLLVLASLAAFRAWWFLAHDSLPLVAAPREWIDARIRRRHGDEWADGLACAWCLGAWCSIAVVGAVWSQRPLALPALWFLAVSAAVGLIAMVVED